jgi:hypothetical protein
MSDTPRTDNYRSQGREWFPIGIFEDLERENNKLRKQLHRSMQLFGSLTGEWRKLSGAAQAVVDRWETPLWKDAEPTAAVIYRLRDILANTTMSCTAPKEDA